jgi:hypothetical protein
MIPFNLYYEMIGTKSYVTVIPLLPQYGRLHYLI